MKFLSVVVVIVLVAGLSAGGVYFLMKGGLRTETVVTVEGIKEIAQLASVEYTITAIVKKEKPPAWYEWASTIYLTQGSGTVTGYVDLNKMKIDVSTDPVQKRVDLRFEPDAIKIGNAALIPESVVSYNCDVNVFTDITQEEKDAALRELLTEMRDTAIQQGIRQKTASEAKEVLTRFLEQLGYEVNIVFAEQDL